MNKWDIGQVVSLEDYTEIAVKCNELADRHIEKQGDQYVIVANEVHVPTLEEQVIELEERYNMCRWQREIILADGTMSSDFAKARAQEIEDLAEQLRD